jgi:hypothetical protein
MSDPNFIEQASALAANAGIDTSSVIDAVSAHVPGGEAVAGVLKTGLNMATNKADNSEASEENEGAGGLLGAVGGLLGQDSEA